MYTYRMHTHLLSEYNHQTFIDMYIYISALQLENKY